MPNALQLFAVSALIGECQSLLASTTLNPWQQASLRCLIAHAQAAFSQRKSEEEAVWPRAIPFDHHHRHQPGDQRNDDHHH